MTPKERFYAKAVDYERNGSTKPIRQNDLHPNESENLRWFYSTAARGASPVKTNSATPEKQIILYLRARSKGR